MQIARQSAALSLEPHAIDVGAPSDARSAAQLRRGELETRVSRGVALLLTAAFVLLVGGVPIAQAVLERVQDEPSSLAGLFERAPSSENLRQFEHELEQASYAKAYVQPRVQQLLSAQGGAGNRRVVLGKDGFLYYTPGVTHVAGPDFLSAEALAGRKAQAHSDDPGAILQPDPRPAIFQLQAMLARRGIRLVVFPVPDKASLQPLQLHGRDAAHPRLARNRGWDGFAGQLRAHGVQLFEASPPALRPGEPSRFLIQDTHWTPQWMQQVAHELAAFVQHSAALPAQSGPPRWHAVPQTVERVGDLVDMLKLPETQSVFRPQRVEIAQLQDAAGEPWQPDPAADVLLLGDSFTNVFSLDSMEWGQAAGLAPALALALGRDVDVIAQNDSGAFATREALYRELQAGHDRLAGKRVVIWEFAARELSVGDFKTVPWAQLPQAGAR